MNGSSKRECSAALGVCVALALLAAPLAFSTNPPAAPAGAKPTSPDDVVRSPDPKVAAAEAALKSKGLSRAGSYYLLSDDVLLSEALREIQRSEAQLKAFIERRRVVERDIARATKSVRQWWKEVDEIARERERIRGNVKRYNQLADESNARHRKIDDAEKYIARREGDLRKMAAPDTHVAQTVALADRLEAAAKRYVDLASDVEVAKALEQLNADSKFKLRLGPSPEFASQLPRLVRLREQAKLSTIPVAVHNNSATVNVTINGGKPVPMVVDTGATTIILTAEVAEQLRLPELPDDTETTFGFADGSQRKGRVTRLASVRVGPYTVRDVECGILPPGTADECLLGATFFKHFIVRLDFAGAKLHLTPLADGLGKPEAGTPATQPGLAEGGAGPAKPAEPLGVLTIEATVDGGDIIVVTPDGLKWEHESWGWPTDVRVNGDPWDPRAQDRLAYKGPLVFLGRADLESARVVGKSGRGDITTAGSPEGLRIRFGDGPNGSAPYRIEVAFFAKGGDAPPAAGNADPRPAHVRSTLIGGRGGGEYREVATNKAVLVGLNVTAAKFFGNDVIGGVQPVFGGRGSETAGSWYAHAPNAKRKPTAVVAKRGYAVGGMRVRGGQRVDGFQLIFMRFNAATGRLDPSDAYESEWVGGQGGGEPRTLGGDGKTVVGIHGRHGVDLDAIGIIQVE